MTADELLGSLLRAAEPPVPAVVALAAELGRSAFPEQRSSAPGGVIARQEPTRTSAAGKLVTELPTPAAIALAAMRVLPPFHAGGGTNADELRWARAFLLRVAEPPAPAVVVSVARSGGFPGAVGRAAVLGWRCVRRRSRPGADPSRAGVGLSADELTGVGLSEDELRWVRAFPVRAAEPPAPAVVASVAGRLLVASLEGAVEPLGWRCVCRWWRPGASTSRADGGLSACRQSRPGAGTSTAGGGLSTDEVRQTRACRLRVAEPPAPAVVAFVAGRFPVAFPGRAIEPPESAGVAFADGGGPVLVCRERVAA